MMNLKQALFLSILFAFGSALFALIISVSKNITFEEAVVILLVCYGVICVILFSGFLFCVVYDKLGEEK